MKLRILLSFFLLANIGVLMAQNRLKPYEEYIDTYADLAREQQEKHGIPASITLAQGLLESGAGKSELALASNNHFGIKCHNNWKGESVTYFDDGRNSCFRKYDKVSESYTDHSLFLVNGARYRFLFELDITDYTGWARGLQKAGYATDRQYADKLIRVIETYDLNQYTKGPVKKRGKTATASTAKSRREAAKAAKVARTSKTDRTSKRTADTTIFTSDIIRQAQDYHAMGPVTDKPGINPLATHVIDYVGTTPYIRVKYGDSFAAIAEEFGLSVRRLRSINDLPADHTLIPGEILYLDSKTTWWEGENPSHIATEGETMHQIAQRYALKLKALYQLNDLAPGTPIKAGQRILLRNPEKMSSFVRTINQVINNPDSLNLSN